jgi:hypothetical protein
MNQENKKKSPRKIITQPFDFSVQDLVDKIKNKDINLNPDYQRNYTWGTNDYANKRSLLIESLLLNIPIPVIYFAETKTLNYEVIDGQQRLQTFCDFMDDKFCLRDLAIRDELNSKKYSQLSAQDQNQIRKRSIRAILILEDSDEKLKYEVFERLNLGSVQLSKQEVRNATLRGKFNDLLKKLASDNIFRSRLQLRLKQDADNMAYEEMILRFFAYHDNKLKRATDLATFLTDYMRGKQDLKENEIRKLENLFLETLKKVDEYLGEDAFTISIFKDNNKWKKKTNRVLYDAEMLAFSSLIDGSENRQPINSSEFKNKLSEFFNSDSKISKDFRKSLTDQAGGKKIQERVNQIKAILFQK